MPFKKTQSAGPGPQPGRAGLPDPEEFPLFHRDLREAQDRAGLVRRFDTAPAPAREQPARPDFDQINARAAELKQSVVDAHAALNDSDPENARDRCIALDVAEHQLYLHLDGYRDVLGESPQWAREYALYDAPEPPRRGDLAFPDAPEL